MPILCKKARRIVSELVKPQRDATRCNGVSLSSSSRLAASTRAISTNSAGVVPVATAPALAEHSDPQLLSRPSRWDGRASGDGSMESRRQNIGKAGQITELFHPLRLVRKLQRVEVGVGHHHVVGLPADPSAHTPRSPSDRGSTPPAQGRRPCGCGVRAHPRRGSRGDRRHEPRAAYPGHATLAGLAD